MIENRQIYNRRGKVYFVRPVGHAGPIKIGFTSYMRERMNAMLAWSPYRLEILAMIDGDLGVEKALHKKFAEHRLHHEWFTPAKELLEFIESVTSASVSLEAA